MIYYKKVKSYKISAHLYKGKKICVDIAFKGKYPNSNLFIINKFNQIRNNEKIFKEIFDYFISKENENFVDFLSEKDYFYAIFKYNKEQNLIYKYNKAKCIDTFEVRFKILESILISLHNMFLSEKFPSIILFNITKCENIVIDSGDSFYFNYDLRNLKNDYENKKKELFKNISNIIKTMFEVEMSSKYNKIIQIIFRKCELSLYSSVPELIMDFKHNKENIRISSFLMYIKNQFKMGKPILSHLSRAIILPALLVAFFYLIFSNFFKKDTSTPREVTIGETTYSLGNQEVNKNKKIILETNSNSILKNKKKSENIKLPLDFNPEWEDHITKNGESLSTISREYYNSDSTEYIQILALFNHLENKDFLKLGKILKIPTKKSLNKFFEEESK